MRAHNPIVSGTREGSEGEVTHESSVSSSRGALGAFNWTARRPPLTYSGTGWRCRSPQPPAAPLALSGRDEPPAALS